MKTTSKEGRSYQAWFANRTPRLGKVVRPRTGLIVLIAIAASATMDTAYGQALIGSPGAGWQTWTAALDANFNGIDLNNNGAPYWDVIWGASGATYGLGAAAEKNPGFCMTSTGDCQGIGSALAAPGALPFWAMPYNSATDTGGARDNVVYFHSTGARLTATLMLNASANANEINEFGWFETNASGTFLGTRHLLFQGSGEPAGTLTPDPVGSVATFTPTVYFGFYYSDVSEPACPNGSNPPCSPPGPLHGCYTYTVFAFVEPRCLESTGKQGDHDFVVFGKNTDSERPTYWVVGEDPVDCKAKDGDCNLTIVRVRGGED